MRLRGEDYSDKDPFRVTIKPPLLGVVVNCFNNLFSFARVAEFAEEIFFFSAERAEKKKIYAVKLSKRHSRVIKCKCSHKIVL